MSALRASATASASLPQRLHERRGAASRSSIFCARGLLLGGIFASPLSPRPSARARARLLLARARAPLARPPPPRRAPLLARLDRACSSCAAIVLRCFSSCFARRLRHLGLERVARAPERGEKTFPLRAGGWPLYSVRVLWRPRALGGQGLDENLDVGLVLDGELTLLDLLAVDGLDAPDGHVVRGLVAAEAEHALRSWRSVEVVPLWFIPARAFSLSREASMSSTCLRCTDGSRILMINRELGGIDTRAGDGCDAASRHRRRPRLRSGAISNNRSGREEVGSGSTGTHLSVLLLTMPLRSNLASTLKHQTSAMVSRAAAPLASARVVVSSAGFKPGCRFASGTHRFQTSDFELRTQGRVELTLWYQVCTIFQ